MPTTYRIQSSGGVTNYRHAESYAELAQYLRSEGYERVRASDYYQKDVFSRDGLYLHTSAWCILEED